ncbi:hypothetical protein [Verrucomicrobium spinosum]|uniref:hypothetical protein n=1 Tax=Verrucomicrobium spinosum TaxID=2736 RepID=UPI0001746926|nr:hypothetical protein [Verrucomicrobium spinosum]
MSQRITFSLPDKVVEALEAKAAVFEMTPGELIQHRLLMSAMGVDLPFNLAVVLEIKAEEPAEPSLQEMELVLEPERPALPSPPPQPRSDDKV